MKIYGNTDLVAALHSMAGSGKVPHAILLHENDGGGAFPIAIDFLTALYGGNPRVEKLIHPDIHFVFPVAGPDKPVSAQFLTKWREMALENPYFTEDELYSAIGIEGKQGNISVGEARSILDTLSLSAVEGGYRTVVIYLPEKMNVQAANTLLKMVEEPPEKTLFIMIAHQDERVLQTISSRCLSMRVRPLSREEAEDAHSAGREESARMRDLFHDLMNALVEKDLLSALEAAEVMAALPSREKQKSFCIRASESIRNIFLLQQGLSSLADIPEGEEEFYRKVAASGRKSFPRHAAAAIDRAVTLLERNVSQKILFTDLACRLYTNI